MENEIWKDIPEYEGLYQVSNFGRVKSLCKSKLHKGKYLVQLQEKILKPIKNKQGYFYINLVKDKKNKIGKIHQLVAIAFLGHKPDGTNKIIVDHIDNNKTNNNLYNLQLISHRENLSKDKKNSSQYTGVSYCKPRNRWRAEITINYKLNFLGYFKEEIDAHNAYQNALNKIRNE